MCGILNVFGGNFAVGEMESPLYFLLMPAGGPAWGPRGVWGRLIP